MFSLEYVAPPLLLFFIFILLHGVLQVQLPWNRRAIKWHTGTATCQKRGNCRIYTVEKKSPSKVQQEAEKYRVFGQKDRNHYQRKSPRNHQKCGIQGSRS
jgi:hypothetical protein